MTLNIKAIAADIASELKEHPERWTQEALCKTSDKPLIGEVALESINHPAVVCWCLEGHVVRRVPAQSQYMTVLVHFMEELEKTDKMIASVWQWNDAPERTVADVIALCERIAKEAA